MVDKIADINSVINNYVWGVPAMVLILTAGIFLSVKTHFIQITKFFHSMKMTIGKIFDKKETKKGSITPLQAVCTALAATVGTGNIAGVAGAIAIGGPGAVFWMWISALFGMCTKFCEVTLSVLFREQNKDGEYVGGPMYYIKNGMHKRWRFLSVLFAIFCILAAFGIGNAVQVNTISTTIGTLFSNVNHTVINWSIGIIVCILVAVILIGGLKRLANVTQTLVPIMGIVYLLMAVIAIIINYKYLPYAFISIFKGAFNPSAVTGGIVGSIIITLRKGFSRGVFSNEAGLGSAPIVHATTSEQNPVKQGFWGIFEVFFDTIIICTLTSLVILCGLHNNVGYGTDIGVKLALNAFTSTYGAWCIIPLSFVICSFAFSTILGWEYYGITCIDYLFGPKAKKPYIIFFSLISIIGAVGHLTVIWDISDTINGLMMIPNMIAVLILSPNVFKLVKEYKKE